MSLRALIVRGWVWVGFLSWVGVVMAQVPAPRLGIERAGEGVRLRWSRATDPAFRLEQATGLSPGVVWGGVSAGVEEGAEFWSATVVPGGQATFYRLRRENDAGPTRVEETYPGRGETGVSVNRETILRFSRPLALTTVLGGEEWYATVDGRRLLARSEIASDRRSATLFYLEDLPGGARVQVWFDGDRVYDVQGQAVDADGDGVAGGALLLTFETTVNAAVPGTAVVGRVFASDLVAGADTGTNAVNRPLAGVTITVDGAEETLRVVTDEQGNFVLSPCPAGRFFVHIDGRTAWESQWPAGDYYPFVGKAWEAVAGVSTNLAGGNGLIYLPRIAAGSLQRVLASAPTTITFPPSVLAANPGLEGVSVTVPANALFDESGTRGGRIGIAPVPPDRLPEPLPSGLRFPLVITVQSDGPANFDQPVPLRFPNLPDPETGERLPAGAKTALWAFNHDTGRWEIRGPMTVSADGRFVECDPGTGILQPGWVGTNPGSPSSGGPPRPPRPPVPPDRQPDCDNPFVMVAKENLLLQYASAMAGLAGSGNYAGEALRHFLLGDGSPQHYPPGSGPSEDLLRSREVQNELGQIRDSLQAAARRAIGQNSEFPTVDDFRHETGNMGFYGESESFPHQLSYTFGDISGGNATAQLSDIYVVHTPDGGYEYFAKLRFRITERYEFNDNDNDGLVGMARQLQECGYAEPFEVSIEFELDLRGSVTARAEAAMQAVRRVQPALGGGGPHVYVARDRTTQVVPVGDELLVLHPNGRSAVVRASGALSGTFDFLIEDAETGQFVMRGTRRGSEHAFVDLILPPSRSLRLVAVHRETLTLAEAVFRSEASGSPTVIPELGFAEPFAGPDTDGDGLTDEMEAALGTRVDRADTDGDGVTDGAELRAGQDPSSGLTPATGVVASVRTGGVPTDIAASDDLVVVADGSAGVAVFNVFGGLEPVRIAQLGLENGSVGAVAFDGRWIAATAGTRVGIWEVAGGPEPVLRHVVELGQAAGEVVVDAGGLYVASEKAVIRIDAETGVVLDRREYVTEPSERIHDLSVAGDALYVLSAAPGVSGSHTVQRVPLAEILLPASSVLTIPGTEHPTFGRMHVFATGTHLFVGSADDNAQTQRPGVLVIEDSARGLMLVGRPSPITAFDVAVDSVGLGLFTGADPGLEGSARVGVLDVRDPRVTDQFLTSYDTPGSARALTLHQGLAYVADSQAGLVVVHYLPFDRAGRAPSLRLSSSASGGLVRAGDRLRLTATVTDDVQVRRVEFYLDDDRIGTDGGFPFEYSWRLPGNLPAGATMVIRARAVDTGGNEAWSEALTLTVTDAGRSRGEYRLIPGADEVTQSVTAVGVILDATLSPSTPVGAETIGLVWAGADGRFDSTDDEDVTIGTVRYLAGARALLLALPDELRTGSYRATLGSGLRDLSGQFFAPTQWVFRVTFTSTLRVERVWPAGRTRDPVERVDVWFSEPVRDGGPGNPGVRVVAAGADGVLGNGDDVEIVGTVETAGGGRVLTFVPAERLASGRYEIRIQESVTDLAGNPIPGARLHLFEYEDADAPRVVAHMPEPGAVLGTGPSEVEVYFSEAMEAAGLNSGTVRLSGSGADERLGTLDDESWSGAVSYTPSIRRVTLRFANPLPYGAYRVELGGGIRDVSGNPLAPGEDAEFLVLKTVLVRGTVLLPTGEPLAGAVVRVPGLASPVISGVDGTFVSETFGRLPGERVFARVEHEVAGERREGSSPSVLPRDGVVTELGLIRMESVCPPILSSVTRASGPIESEINAFTRGDTGGGEALYAATGGFYGGKRAGVWRWVESGWRSVGGAFGYAFGGPAHVRALIVHDDGQGPRLYAGGAFDRVDGLPATNIARWTGSGWEPVGRGLPGLGVSGQVLALATLSVDGERRLVAGGSFSEFLGAPRTGVMVWDGAGWSPFSGGLSNAVSAVPTVNALLTTMEQGEPTLYAGGYLTVVEGEPAGHLARWQAGRWRPVPGGVTRSGLTNAATIRSLAWHDSGAGPEVFVGGSFDAVDGIPALSVARWDGARWRPAGVGFYYTFQGVPGTVNGFLGGAGPVPGLWAVGLFNRIGATTFRSNGPGLARWNGIDWEPWVDGSGRTNEMNGAVHAIAEWGTGTRRHLFLGGSFSGVLSDRQTYSLDYVARLSESGWEVAGQNLDRPVTALAWAAVGAEAPALFGGGGFRWGGSEVLHGLFRWNEGVYEAVGGGVRMEPGLTPGMVMGLTAGEVEGTPSLYVYGQFDWAGTNRVGSIARWDGTRWSGLGSGVRSAFGGAVVLAAIGEPSGSGTNLIVAGAFETAGGVPARSIARWDGSGWSALGGGLGGTVRALARWETTQGPQLFAAGDFQFSDASFVVHRGIGRWDGTRWLPVSGRRSGAPTGSYLTLAVHDDGTGTALYAGGYFEDAASGEPSNGVVRWNGVEWEHLSPVAGDIRFASVAAMVSHQDGSGSRLYAIVRPDFASAPDQEPRLATWDGVRWEIHGESRLPEMHGLVPGVEVQGSFWVGGGVNPFDGGLWQWSWPTAPCPAGVVP